MDGRAQSRTRHVEKVNVKNGHSKTVPSTGERDYKAFLANKIQ